MIEYIFIVIDIVTDTIADYHHDDLIIQLYLYFFQDLSLLFALMILFLQFFREEILRSHLLLTTIRNNWHIIVIYVINILTSISWQIVHNISTLKSTWEPLFVLHIMKRLISVLYYFCLIKSIQVKEKS